MSVIADAYLAGVSTRRVEKLVQQLGVERMSKSQVSRLAKSLDEIVEEFRTRPLDGAPYALLHPQRKQPLRALQLTVPDPAALPSSDLEGWVSQRAPQIHPHWMSAGGSVRVSAGQHGAP